MDPCEHSHGASRYFEFLHMSFQLFKAHLHHRKKPRLSTSSYGLSEHLNLAPSSIRPSPATSGSASFKNRISIAYSIKSEKPPEFEIRTRNCEADIQNKQNGWPTLPSCQLYTVPFVCEPMYACTAATIVGTFPRAETSLSV